MRRVSRQIVPLLAAVAVAVSAGAGWAVAAATSTGGVIHACAAKSGGALRLSLTCSQSERAVAWDLQGAPGPPGTARAFGLVAANGTLTRSKNATVTHVAGGDYCITLAPGIDAKRTGIIATPDFGDDTTQPGAGPDNSAHIEWGSGGSCPANSLAVETFKVNNANGGGDHYDVEFADEAFFFAVP